MAQEISRDALLHVGRDTFFAGVLDSVGLHSHAVPVYLAGLYGAFRLRIADGGGSLAGLQLFRQALRTNWMPGKCRWPFSIQRQGELTCRGWRRWSASALTDAASSPARPGKLDYSRTLRKRTQPWLDRRGTRQSVRQFGGQPPPVSPGHPLGQCDRRPAPDAGGRSLCRVRCRHAGVVVLPTDAPVCRANGHPLSSISAVVSPPVKHAERRCRAKPDHGGNRRRFFRFPAFQSRVPPQPGSSGVRSVAPRGSDQPVADFACCRCRRSGLRP